MRRATHGFMPLQIQAKKFLPTLSMRRATSGRRGRNAGIHISTHALHAESDMKTCPACHEINGFLPTLSMRRATLCDGTCMEKEGYFYPRSPCGERHDFFLFPQVTGKFLPTLSMRRATTAASIILGAACISTHALHAESDRPLLITRYQERKNFYPRSPCGERPNIWTDPYTPEEFLPTLSMRRATAFENILRVIVIISTHALHAESDGNPLNCAGATTLFLPTLSMRRATIKSQSTVSISGISTHALHAESDLLV